MSTQTNKLGLFKYDPIVDKEELFDIQEALNDNWDKIDSNLITNIEEGLATGSLKTVSARAESSDYSLGVNAMAIGIDTSARGEGSFAEGISTTAYGKYSHTEGEGSSASGMASHAEGSGTIASIESQHVEGKYNIDDTTAIHVVGNGTSNSERSNAHTLNLNGEAWFAGDIYTGSTSGTHKDEGSKKLLTEDDIDTLNQAITNKADKTSLIVLDEPIIINLTLESNEVYTLSTPIELIEKEIWHCESYCVSEGVEYHDFGLGRVLNDGNDNLSISFLNGCGVLTNTTFTNGNSLANTFTISKVLEYNKTPNYLID